MRIKSTSFIIMMLIPMLTVFMVGEISPSHATIDGKKAILQVWSATTKSSVVVDSSIRGSVSFQLSVNVTDAGSSNGFDVTITYDPAFLTATVADYSVGIFASGNELVHQVNNPAGTTREAVSLSGGFINQNGILFRMTFTVSNTRSASNVKITPASAIYNPGTIAYQAINGWVDDNLTPVLSYTLTLNVSSITVTRPILDTDPPVVKHVQVTVTRTAGGTPGSAVLGNVSLPSKGVTYSNSPACLTACNMPISSVLSVIIKGGASGGSTTAPSGTFATAVSANSTQATGNIVVIAWLQLIILPPPPPVYSITGNVTSQTILGGASHNVTLTGSLTAGTGDPVTLNCNLSTRAVGSDCFFPPGAVQWTGGPGCTKPCSFTAKMNITTGINSPTGQGSECTARGLTCTVIFNVTAVSTGTYSEQSVSIVAIKNFQLTILPHDVGVASIQLSRGIYYNETSNPLSITLNATNIGYGTETFYIVEYANGTQIGNTTISSLAPRSFRIVTFAGDSPGFQSLKPGVYIITATASTAPGDGNFANQTVQGANLGVHCKGDINGDHKLNVIDLSSVGSTFGLNQGQAGFNPVADLNNDGKVNVVDLSAVGAVFGTTC